ACGGRWCRTGRSSGGGGPCRASLGAQPGSDSFRLAPSLALPRMGGGRTAPGGLDDGVDAPGRQVVVELVRVAHHGGVLAAAEALDLLQAEEPILAHLPELLHADPGLDVVADLDGAAQRAGEVRADVEVMLPRGPEVEERVEGGDALHVTRVEPQQL